MPMDLSRYPRNWKEIAIAVKEAANWKCQQCGIDCSDPKQWRGDRHLQALFTLTVHHSDYNPENNSPENLIALCSGCHLAKHQGRRGNISPGQLSLFNRWAKNPTD